LVEKTICLNNVTNLGSYSLANTRAREVIIGSPENHIDVLSLNGNDILTSIWLKGGPFNTEYTPITLYVTTGWTSENDSEYLTKLGLAGESGLELTIIDQNNISYTYTIA
jgi:hypothetical protein